MDNEHSSESSSDDQTGHLNIYYNSDKFAEDIMETAEYQGQSIYEVDIDKLPKKPWRKDCTPQELSQYFNYGFDEATWRLYCEMLKENKSLINK